VRARSAPIRSAIPAHREQLPAPVWGALLEVAITGVVVYNLSKLVVDAPALAQYGGDYFDFAMVGLAVMSVARLGIEYVQPEHPARAGARHDGILLSTPTPIGAARRFVRFPDAGDGDRHRLVLRLHRGVRRGIASDRRALVGPLLALTLASFCAFGIVSASLLVLISGAIR
jgi:hypothetical protein